MFIQNSVFAAVSVWHVRVAVITCVFTLQDRGRVGAREGSEAYQARGDL